MKKIVRLILCFLTVFFCAGCGEKGPIPNGYYCWSSQGENIFLYTESNIRDSFGWEIEGDEAQRWTSGSVDYKAKIVKKDGKIYFEGYKWRDFLDVISCDGDKHGSTYDYAVDYNKTEKTVTLTLIED